MPFKNYFWGDHRNIGITDKPIEIVLIDSLFFHRSSNLMRQQIDSVQSIHLQIKNTQPELTQSMSIPNSNTPFFSVIIPTYNRGFCILEAINSILNQDYLFWELIIVDDGSTDNTAEIVKSIKDPRIKYFYKINEERGAARNFGVTKAIGEYIFFLDSDDIVKTSYLSSAFQLIQKTKTDCLHIPYNYLIDKKEQNGPSLTGTAKNKIRKQNRFACQIIVKKKCCEEFKFSENRNFKIGEDWYFILLLMSKYNFVIGEERLGLLVKHSLRSMINTPYDQVLISKEIFLEELKKNLPTDVGVYKNVDHELTNLAALQAAIQGEKKQSFQLLRKSIAIHPRRIFRFRNFVIVKKILFN